MSCSGRLEVIPDPIARPVMSAEEAFAALGIERHTGYKAINDGTFPVPVVRVGRLIRVPTSPLRRLLAIDPPSAEVSNAVRPPDGGTS
jgi:predicted DNA-binding transcriptional regulator AlpA